MLVMKEANRIYEINDNMSREELAARFALLKDSTEETTLASSEEEPKAKPLAS